MSILTECLIILIIASMIAYIISRFLCFSINKEKDKDEITNKNK